LVYFNLKMSIYPESQAEDNELFYSIELHGNRIWTFRREGTATSPTHASNVQPKEATVA
jgi:hypothetical protein